MKLLLIPLFAFVIFITNPRPTKKLKVYLTVIFVSLAWLNVYLLYSKLDPNYFKIASGALYLLAALCYVMTFKKKVPPSHELISFKCPFCSNKVEFDIVDQGKSKHCPSCNEVITVTTDEEVHKKAKESYEAILEAMDNEELQVEGDLVQPSIETSVLGFQFDLNKGELKNEDDSEEQSKQS